MKKGALFAFLIAAATSSLVWAVSPWFTGHREPWDAEKPFYPVALLAAGGTAGALAPRPLWAHYLGSFIGQLSYQILFLEVGPLLLLGAIFLLGYGLVFVAGAGLTGYARLRLKSP